MRIGFRKGIGFGLTSGIITTLGLIIGLTTSTESKIAVIGGILTIAIADAFSDALGMHISEEYGSKKQTRSVWEAMGSTFAAKFVFALSFLIPVLFLDLWNAMIVSIIWGLFAITSLSYIVAKKENNSPLRVIREHLTITIIVVIVTYFVGEWIHTVFM